MRLQFVYNPDLSCAYTQTTFNYAMALTTQNVKFHLRSLQAMLNWSFTPSWAEPLRTYKGDNFLDDIQVELNNFQIGDIAKAPHEAQAKAVGISTFETTYLPQWLVDTLKSTQQGLIVPSTHNEVALRTSGFTKKVHVVEHALNPYWLQDYPHLSKTSNQPHIFGYIGAWNGRKNPISLVEAYVKAFPRDLGDTALFIKTYAPSGVEDQIKFIVNKFSEQKERNDIWFYNEIWSEEQMLWAVNQFDTYVSAHRGEGFGLGLAQAAAQRKPVIYTNYSAPCEWLPRSEGHMPIDCNLIQVMGASDSFNLHFSTTADERLMWAEPNLDHLIETLRSRANQNSQVSDEGVLRLRKQLAWNTIGEKLVHAIEDITQVELERFVNDSERHSS